MELLTQRAAAAYLGISSRTLRRWENDGGGPPKMNVGAHGRYTKSDIDAWLTSVNELQSLSQAIAELRRTSSEELAGLVHEDRTNFNDGRAITALATCELTCRACAIEQKYYAAENALGRSKALSVNKLAKLTLKYEIGDSG